MYIIWNYRSSKKGININNAELMLREGNRVERLFRFQHATPNGWKSDAPILVDFPYTATSEGFACEVLVISDEVAQALIARFGDVKVKIWESAESRSASAMWRMAEMINPDGGWCGGDCSASTWVRP